MSKVQKQLKDRAGKLKKTKYRIAKDTGHAEGMIGKVIEGENNPRLSTLENIASVLDGTIQFVPNNTAAISTTITKIKKTK